MKTARPAFREGRKEQRTPARVPDSYKSLAKLPDPALCPRCGAVYMRGRWSWKEAVPGAVHRNCPACRRIEDDFPAGEVNISGPFFAEHREELLALVKAVEMRARDEHPMQRLIAVRETGGGVQVTTTDPHLARGIAVALQGAFKGDLDLVFGPEDDFVRATWSR